MVKCKKLLPDTSKNRIVHSLEREFNVYLDTFEVNIHNSLFCSEYGQGYNGQELVFNNKKRYINWPQKSKSYNSDFLWLNLELFWIYVVPLIHSTLPFMSKSIPPINFITKCNFLLSPFYFHLYNANAIFLIPCCLANYKQHKVLLAVLPVFIVLMIEIW